MGPASAGRGKTKAPTRGDKRKTRLCGRKPNRIAGHVHTLAQKVARLRCARSDTGRRPRSQEPHHRQVYNIALHCPKQTAKPDGLEDGFQEVARHVSQAAPRSFGRRQGRPSRTPHRPGLDWEMAAPCCWLSISFSAPIGSSRWNQPPPCGPCTAARSAPDVYYQ